MSKKLTVENILPMSNVGGEKLLGQPDILLNMDAFTNSVEQRPGRTQLASLINCHSLQAVDDYFLCGAKGLTFPRSIWWIDLQGNKTELAELSGLSKLYYKELGNIVYVSSKEESFKYNKLTRLIEPWGIPVPEVGPDVTVVGGGLPPGKYSLCFTRKNSTGGLSGAGPVTEIELTITGGLKINNSATDFLIWMTDVNGAKFYLTRSSFFIQKSSGVELLPTLDVIPPNGLENLIFFRGRLMGSLNGKILYSDSYAFDWFRSYNSFEFKDDILMLAEDANGIYIGTEKDTWYQSGDNIRNMQLKKIGEGVIKGALVYAPVGPDDIRVPVWASPEGIFAGIGGKAASLTDDKVNIQLKGVGAAFFKNLKGSIQIGINAPPREGAGISDKAIVQVFREGRIITATYNEFVRDHIDLSDLITET